MIAMPATIDNSADQTRNNPPIALALAPSATNTVAKPSTNRQAASNVSRLHARVGLIVGKPLQRGARHIDEIRRHQRQHAGRQERDQARE